MMNVSIMVFWLEAMTSFRFPAPFCGLFVEMNHLGAKLMPFRVPVYQLLALLGIVRNLVHKLNIPLAKHFALINHALKLKQSRKPLLLEPLYQSINDANLVF
jgi:hypothetical protein